MTTLDRIYKSYGNVFNIPGMSVSLEASPFQFDPLLLTQASLCLRATRPRIWYQPIIDNVYADRLSDYITGTADTFIAAKMAAATGKVKNVTVTTVSPRKQTTTTTGGITKTEMLGQKTTSTVSGGVDTVKTEAQMQTTTATNDEYFDGGNVRSAPRSRTVTTVEPAAPTTTTTTKPEQTTTVTTQPTTQTTTTPGGTTTISAEQSTTVVGEDPAWATVDNNAWLRGWVINWLHAVAETAVQIAAEVDRA